MSELIKHPSVGEFNEIKENSELVLVDFYADWCTPCKMLSPAIEEIAKEYENKVTVCKVNIDENEELAMEYSVQSIPTVILFRKGEVVEEIIGLNDKSRYEKLIDSQLAQTM